MTNRRIAIIGAGITGLVSAWRLQNEGNEVVVYERKPEPGGAIKTVRENGWQVEYGPNTLQLKSHKLLDFIREIGLEKDIIDAEPAGMNRYVLKDGVLTPVPLSLSELFRSGLFSSSAKWGLLKEPFIRRGSDPDESVSSFVGRRLGREILEYGVNPFIAGVFAGDPGQLSVRHVFPQMYHLERTYGTLLLGALVKKFQQYQRPRFKTRLVSFRQGLGQLPEAIASTLDEIRYGEDVSRIQQTTGGWEVISNGVRSSAFDSVLLNIPLYRINEQLINGGGQILDILDKTGYPPLSVLHTGYKRSQVGHALDGFGYLVPEKEGRKILGSLFSSSLFNGRTPEGHVLLTTFIGGSRQPEFGSLQTEPLLDLVKKELKETLDVTGPPVFVDHIYWPKSIPQYGLGYSDVLKAIESVEKLNDGVRLIGNYRGGISLPDCIMNGLTM